jgi:hypothetical protein
LELDASLKALRHSTGETGEPGDPAESAQTIRFETEEGREEFLSWLVEEYPDVIVTVGRDSSEVLLENYATVERLTRQNIMAVARDHDGQRLD